MFLVLLSDVTNVCLKLLEGKVNFFQPWNGMSGFLDYRANYLKKKFDTVLLQGVETAIEADRDGLQQALG